MLTMELIKYKHRFSLKKQCSKRIKWLNTLTEPEMERSVEHLPQGK